MLTVAAYADDNTLYDVAKKHQLIGSNSDVFICDLAGKNYIVSIGVATVAGTEPKHILNARNISKMNAKKALTNFIHNVKISSSETLTSERSRLTVYKNGNKSQVSETDKSSYESIISEKGEGLLRNTIDVGMWVASDSSDYLHALAIEIK